MGAVLSDDAPLQIIDRADVEDGRSRYPSDLRDGLEAAIGVHINRGDWQGRVTPRAFLRERSPMR